MNLSEAILDLLFPPKCPFCRDILADPRAPLCPGCQPKLPWMEGNRAEGKVDFADGCFSPLAYRGAVPDGVHRYKFGRNRACGAPFATLMAQCVRDHLKEDVDAITWAPLSRARLRERGFDQAQLLARCLGEELKRPLLPTLEKSRHTTPQSDLKSEGARRANALGAYVLLPGCDVKGKCLLLVDDVVTSGATLSECCRILKQAGAKRVWCVTLASAGKK